MNGKDTTDGRGASTDQETDEPASGRRSVLRAMGGLGAAGLLGGSTLSGVTDATVGSPGATGAVALRSDHTSPDLERWVDEVPRPDTLEQSGTKDGDPFYEVEMRATEQKLHRDLPPTTLFGYEGQYPGPTIEAQRGDPVYVRWKNDLPDEHILPVDDSIHEDVIPYDDTGVRTVVHLHGGNVESASDGHAQGWFTSDFETKGPSFTKKDYYYDNLQPPTTLWYHDHTLATTRLNVYAGLSGFYLLRGADESALGLPQDQYEIPLLLQDRAFEEDGSLFYPRNADGDDSGPENPDPSIVSHFFGDTSVVNGKAWPRLSVEPRKYRIRLLNGSNGRFYNLKLVEYDEASGETGGDGPPFVQLGTDGGFLPEPSRLDDRLLMGPGERNDVVVDFSGYEGETLLLHNDAPVPYRSQVGDGDEDTEPLPEVMLVDVGEEVCGSDPSCIPDSLGRVPEIPTDSLDRIRYLTLVRGRDEFDRPLHLLGDGDHRLGMRQTDPVEQEPAVGDTEVWSFANLSQVTHPMHIHLVQFQVLGRQSLGEFTPADETVDVESLDPPAAYEQGWTDTVAAPPGTVTHVAVHFGEYEGQFSRHTGRYMWHCHLLEHEDHDMMRPYRVVSADGTDGDGEADD